MARGVSVGQGRVDIIRPSPPPRPPPTTTLRTHTLPPRPASRAAPPPALPPSPPLPLPSHPPADDMASSLSRILFISFILCKIALLLSFSSAA